MGEDKLFVEATDLPISNFNKQMAIDNKPKMPNANAVPSTPVTAATVCTVQTHSADQTATQPPTPAENSSEAKRNDDVREIVDGLLDIFDMTNAASSSSCASDTPVTPTKETTNDIDVIFDIAENPGTDDDKDTDPLPIVHGPLGVSISKPKSYRAPITKAKSVSKPTRSKKVSNSLPRFNFDVPLEEFKVTNITVKPPIPRASNTRAIRTKKTIDKVVVIDLSSDDDWISVDDVSTPAQSNKTDQTIAWSSGAISASRIPRASKGPLVLTKEDSDEWNTIDLALDTLEMMPTTETPPIATNQPIASSSGSISDNIISSKVDVTDAKSAPNLLDIDDERYKLLVNSLRDGFFADLRARGILSPTSPASNAPVVSTKKIAPECVVVSDMTPHNDDDLHGSGKDGASSNSTLIDDASKPAPTKKIDQTATLLSYKQTFSISHVDIGKQDAVSNIRSFATKLPLPHRGVMPITTVTTRIETDQPITSAGGMPDTIPEFDLNLYCGERYLHYLEKEWKNLQQRMSEIQKKPSDNVKKPEE